MSDAPLSGAELELWQAVVDMNRLWTESDGSGLERRFHVQMVAVTPDRLPFRSDGAACVASWQGFARANRIREWTTSEEVVRVHGDCGVVAYRYRIVLDTDAGPLTLRGRDLLTWLRTPEGWQVIADHFAPEPAAAPPSEAAVA